MSEGYVFFVVMLIGIVFSIGLSWFFADLITNELFGLDTFDKKKEDPFDKFD